uniref:No apical meristem-associated C-terminal domain-containing protein n=1 Tax=Brassica oleracea var. oleracea TaxID=109376 RepID=A0A0D3AS20_BRAOL
MRGEKRSVCSVCLVSLENSPSSSPRRAIVSLSVVPRRKAILPLRGSARKRRYSLYVVPLSPWLVDETTILSLFVAPRGNEKGPLSLSVQLFLVVALIEGDIWLSVGGSPQRRWCSLSMALRDSVRDKQAFDMFEGKRAQGGSSIKVCFSSISIILMCLLVLAPLSPLPLSSEMDFNPFEDNAKFVDLLNSQQNIVFGSQGSVSVSASQDPFVGSQQEPINCDKLLAEQDIVLISSWLNTSKDPVVGNEQKSVAFWKRIATYYSASPKLSGCEKREASQCKQRCHKLNDLAFEAATRERSSGMNDNDVLKLAHRIFFNNHQKKFTLEHAWKELRADQKWCELSTAKTVRSSKRRKFEDGSHTGSSQVKENNAGVDDDVTCRPAGVKAAKARGKKPLVEAKELDDFKTIWEMKKEDLARKEKLTKMKLLESIFAKQGPLPDYEEDLKINDTPMYPENFFRRRFRMNKPLFMKIVHRLSTKVEFFREKQDALGRSSLSPLQKCIAAIRVLAYGSSADAVDEYLRLGETTARSCVEHFVEGIIYLFDDEYLRRPTPADLQRQLYIGEYRGFPGMIGSIDCMHWGWKNCPTAWKGQYSRGSTPQVTYFVNGREYRMAYYLTDSIYPKWATFIQSISLPQDRKAVLFAQRQEATRKDVEHAFGVLQARFAIVKSPALFWDKAKIGKIMRACIILHNMIVENERDGYNLYNVSEFQQGEDSGSSHVDLTYSTDTPSNIQNMMSVRTTIRDRQKHERLKADLVEHLWQKFGGDEDNN